MPCLGFASFRRWWGLRDEDGHREYHVVHRVRVDNTAGVNEGPAISLTYPGLPLPGSIWAFAGDIDIFAVCTWIATMTPVVDDGERSEFFDIEQVFKSRPSEKCITSSGTGTGTGDNPVNDPLAENPIISGSFTRFTEEKVKSYLGEFFTNSAHERLRGPLVEFDSNRPTIRIQKNEAILDLPTKAALIDNVNSMPIWDFPYRTVKLSSISWMQKFSIDCECYYEVTYEFEVNLETFDRSTMDEGTKVLKGEWNKTTGLWQLININGNPPDPNNPTHFVRITDLYDNPMRLPLNGAGIPAVNINGTGVSDPGEIIIEFYPEIDFLTEIDNLPSTLECV